jgi:uncharacterized membrane protein
VTVKLIHLKKGRLISVSLLLQTQLNQSAFTVYSIQLDPSTFKFIMKVTSIISLLVLAPIVLAMPAELVSDLEQVLNTYQRVTLLLTADL